MIQNAKSEVAHETEEEKYCEYLQRRSIVGHYYRKWVLYPRISAWLQGKVLDFGCGIGDFLSYRAETIGVDTNAHNVQFCRARGLDAFLLEEDAVIPLANASFSGVVMDNVIEHIPENEIDPVIEEVKRVLRPGGTIVVGVPGIKGYELDPDHKVYYSKNDVFDLFTRHQIFINSVISMPINFKVLDKYLRQYCLYFNCRSES